MLINETKLAKELQGGYTQTHEEGTYFINKTKSILVRFQIDSTLPAKIRVLIDSGTLTDMPTPDVRNIVTNIDKPLIRVEKTEYFKEGMVNGRKVIYRIFKVAEEYKLFAEKYVSLFPEARWWGNEQPFIIATDANDNFVGLIMGTRGLNVDAGIIQATL